MFLKMKTEKEQKHHKVHHCPSSCLCFTWEITGAQIILIWEPSEGEVLKTGPGTVLQKSYLGWAMNLFSLRVIHTLWRASRTNIKEIPPPKNRPRRFTHFLLLISNPFSFLSLFPSLPPQLPLGFNTEDFRLFLTYFFFTEHQTVRVLKDRSGSAVCSENMAQE